MRGNVPTHHVIMIYTTCAMTYTNLYDVDIGTYIMIIRIVNEMTTYMYTMCTTYIVITGNILKKNISIMNIVVSQSVGF